MTIILEFDVITEGSKYSFTVHKNRSAKTFVERVSAINPDVRDHGSVSYIIIDDALFAVCPVVVGRTFPNLVCKMSEHRLKVMATLLAKS